MSDPDPPDISCQQFVELVTDYLDGGLAPGVVASIEAHLAVCPGCVTVVDQWRTVIELAGELHEHDVERLPGDVRDDLMAAFRDAAER
jgi:anti-sigma factor RsiW